MSESLPVTGKYSVIQIQRFSDSGNIELPIDITCISFLSDSLIIEKENNNITEYKTKDVELNETESHFFYYITTSNSKELFLLIINKESLFDTTMLNFAKLTSNDGREGIMYSLQKSMFQQFL